MSHPPGSCGPRPEESIAEPGLGEISSLRPDWPGEGAHSPRAVLGLKLFQRRFTFFSAHNRCAPSMEVDQMQFYASTHEVPPNTVLAPERWPNLSVYCIQHPNHTGAANREKLVGSRGRTGFCIPGGGGDDHSSSWDSLCWGVSFQKTSRC